MAIDLNKMRVNRLAKPRRKKVLLSASEDGEQAIRIVKTADSDLREYWFHYNG